MKNSFYLALSMVLSATVLSACDTTSTTRWESPAYSERKVAPPAEFPEIPQKQFEHADGQTRGEGLKFDPRVDILFVIDNSASMAPHQANLRRNINKFVNSIARTKVIDFHIGVTTIYDSVRYGSIVQKTCGGKINYLDNGELTPLQGLATPITERFVSRKQGFVNVLEQTLNVGVSPFLNSSTGCSTGPEEEESFSPIIASFGEKNQTTSNIGFWREGSLKVIMIVSDAFDASKELTPSLVYENLYQLSGSTPNDQKFRIYAVAPIPSQSVNQKTGMIDGSKTCQLDFGYKENGAFPSRVPDHNVAQLVEMAGGRLLSICSSNYGVELAKVGEEIRVATLKDIVYDLPKIPDRSPQRNIRVWFHRDAKVSQELVENEHWYYDAQENRVVIHGMKLDWDEYPDAYISVDYFVYDATDPHNQIIKGSQ
jgi:hypothetical protein